MLDGGDEACVMEVSSHALELHRADAIHFDVAVFTNLTQDHLDFHPTMEDYFQAKRKLFTELKPQASVINLDDSYGRRLAAELEGAITFGIDSAEADYRATEIETSLNGTRFNLHTPEGSSPVSSPLRGRFNVLNVLGAVAASGPWVCRLRPFWAASSRPGRCRVAFSRWTKGSRSRCSSITPTRLIRLRTFCAPPVR